MNFKDSGSNMVAQHGLRVERAPGHPIGLPPEEHTLTIPLQKIEPEPDQHANSGTFYRNLKYIYDEAM